MKFTKMHGLGNDYVYVNCFEETVRNPAALAPLISDRHHGVGADGLILISPSETADACMQIFNADGSEAEMCGNGLRCVAKYVHDRGLARSRGPFSPPGQDVGHPASLRIETGRGLLTVGLTPDAENCVQSVCVDMGPPILDPDEIPVRLAGPEIINHPIRVDHQSLEMTCVSMGNPHAVFVVDSLDETDVPHLGAAIESHDYFPNRINVHFVEILSDQELQVRTWERGSGITMACGTGACACCVAVVLMKRAKRACTTHLPGGDLAINWNKTDGHVYMTGPATEVFEGIWPS